MAPSQLLIDDFQVCIPPLNVIARSEAPEVRKAIVGGDWAAFLLFWHLSSSGPVKVSSITLELDWKTRLTERPSQIFLSSMLLL